jgi:predicted nucleotide-binding protein
MSDDSEDWISAGAALELLKPSMGGFTAQKTIAARAHDGMIRCRAARLAIEDNGRNNIAVPREFWWARGEQALTQNWAAGDFETYIRDRHWKAYGVQFFRADIMSIVPLLPQNPVARRTSSKTQPASGGKIFIGHGRSAAWRELKDFIVHSLKLPYDEFNAEPVAGTTTVDRLKTMLNNAAFAFLVLTAEDERADREIQARMNVIHEAGLFQGRLGFEKAIILREEGCAEFSNIAGLSQLHFPKGVINHTFAEIRRVLERESIIPPDRPRAGKRKS